MKLFGRFASFDILYKSGVATFVRFPFTLICAIVGTIAAIILIEAQGGPELNYLEKLMVVSTLGLPLFTALGCFADKKQWPRSRNWLLQGFGVVLLAVYYFSLPPDLDEPLYSLQRYLLLNISFHFLVAFLPYLGGKQVQGYWQYNKSLFLNFLTALLYSGALYLGLVMALLALNYLFGVKIDNNTYPELLLVIVGIFNTWIFLAGIPKNLEELNSVSDYPKGLKVFTQYILLPLVVLYFIILISYEAKIIITWNWPKGWVSEMVLWYAVVGILSLLLLHPLREQSENKWIKVFSKWFFWALIPLVAMLFLAILVRISDYGFTEMRYYVLAMAVGLTLGVLYLVFSKSKDIRVIPMIICVLALLSAYGPWSAFTVSSKCQQERFENFLINNQMLADGKLQAAPVKLSNETTAEMSSIITYLCNIHGVSSFSRWLPDSVLNPIDTVVRNNRPQKIAEQLGITYMPYYQGAQSQEYFDFTPKEREMIKLSDYDYLIDLGAYNVGTFEQKFSMNGDSLSVSYDIQTYVFKFKLLNARDSALETVEFPLKEPVEVLIDKWRTGQVSQAELIFDVPGKKFDAKLIMREISGWRREKEIIVNLLSAQILLREHKRT